MWNAAEEAVRPKSDGPLRRPVVDARARSIWRTQLVLAFVTVAIALMFAALAPEMFLVTGFSGGLAMIIAITLVGLSVPWQRYGRRVVFLIPLLDTLAIGWMGVGSDAPLSLLWIFPVAWVAAYYSAAYLIGILSLVAALMLVGLFASGLTSHGSGFHVPLLIELLIQLLVLGFAGAIIWVGAQRTSSSKRLLRGQSMRINAALERVTAQKARNQRLLDSLDIGIARVDRSGLLEISNRSFHDLYAVDETAQFHPTRAVEYSDRRGEPVPPAQTTLARASRGELFDDTVWLFGIDGKWRALRTSTYAIGDGSIDNDGVLLIVEDATTSLDPVASRDDARRTLSHELRNPLTAVLGHVDLLRDRDDLGEDVRAQLDVVARAGTRMETLIDQALATGAPVVDAPEVFDLARVVGTSIEAFAPAAQSSGVALDVVLDDDLPVVGDAFRMRQVVDNLLSNAIKFAQRGGKVTVRSSRARDVTLAVTDTGIGMTQIDVDRVFDHGFRASSALQHGIPGTGLGLAIAHDIVLSHGGRIEVSSAPGQGTTMTLHLPSAKEVQPV